MNHIIRKFLFRQRNHHVEYMKAQSNKISSIFVNSRFYAGSSPFAQVKSPCLMLPSVNDKATGETKYSLFNPADEKIIKFKKTSPLPKDARCFWSSQNWLAYVDPSNCQLYLWNPFLSYSNTNYASNDVIRLPSVETLPQNLSEYLLGAVVFSSPPSPSTDNNDCTVMAIQGRCAKLAYCKLGDTKWTSLEGPLASYQDITYSINHQLFYAMGNTGEVEAWDLRDFSCIKRIPIDNYRKLCGRRFRGLELALREYCKTRCYLVESLGDLLMVVRYLDGVSNFSGNFDCDGKIPCRTLRCDVYKLDTSVGGWNYIKWLGDRAIFLGLTASTFIVRAQDYPGVRPNSVYFADDDPYASHFSYCGQDVGMFNLEDNCLEPYYPFGCLKKIKPPLFWVVPNPHLAKEGPQIVECKELSRWY